MSARDGRGEVERLREALERVDSDLMAQLAERVRLARRIGESKRAGGQLALDPAREVAVLRRIAAEARDHDLPTEPVREIFWRIIALCRDAQREPQ